MKNKELIREGVLKSTFETANSKKNHPIVIFTSHQTEHEYIIMFIFCDITWFLIEY